MSCNLLICSIRCCLKSLFFLSCFLYTYEAVVIVPVADMVGESLQCLAAANITVDMLYKQIPFTPQEGKYSCLRIHQLLFNERVFVELETEEEVKCHLYTVFYETFTPFKRNTSFWTQKKNIARLDMLKSTMHNAVPMAYSLDFATVNNDNIATLTVPMRSEQTQATYSGGTRFVRLPLLDTATHYAIALPQYTNNQWSIDFVEQECAVVQYPQEEQEIRQRFVATLKQWTHENSLMPCVFGGCSILDFYEENIFSPTTFTIDNEPMIGWMRENARYPYTGCDASGLIARAAQIVGIPYFYKNTTTARNNLKVIDPSKEVIQHGDLIWSPGHLMVIADITPCTIIEAVSYSSGYGIVHQLPLAMMFEGIATLDELINNYSNQQALVRLDAQGNSIRTIDNYCFLRLLA